MTERARGGLEGAVGRVLVPALAPALVTASALLFLGQVLGVYNPLSASQNPAGEQLQIVSLSLANYLVLQPDRGLYVTALPIVALALVSRLDVDPRLRSPGPASRRAAVVVALVIAVTGLALTVGTVVWVAVTAGYVTVGNVYSSRYEPVSALVSGVGNGLATLTLSSLAAWLLGTASPRPVEGLPVEDTLTAVDDPDPSVFRRPAPDQDA